MNEEPRSAHQIITAQPGAQIQNVVQTFIENINLGITTNYPDYAVRIENFIKNLSESPFWGREENLRTLDNWLNSPSAQPYLFLAAPAGRGKSALLVRWLIRLWERDPDLPIVFVPVSLRYETASRAVFFPALAARLAYLFGEQISTGPIQDYNALQDKVSKYLKRHPPKGRLLIMLDGLDEATDLEMGLGRYLFPYSPPEGLRVVVSARYLAGESGPEGWLRRLGWNDHRLARSLDLKPLTREEVAEALQSMPSPLGELGHQEEIVNELYRLSEEGEPLLVRLYLDALSKKANELREKREAAVSLRPEDLLSLSPDLKSYFEQWLDDQRKQWKQRGEGDPLSKPNVQDLLNLLAAALAPLTREALQDISRLNTQEIDDAIRCLERLVIGDGEKQGYTFSHMSLRRYFWEKLSPNERDSLDKRFLEWGLRWVQQLCQGEVNLDQISPRLPYLVHALGEHLERSNAKPEDWLHLVDRTWAEAVKKLKNSYELFIMDVERAWRACSRINRERIKRGESPSYLGAEIRCALVKASLVGQSRK